MLKNIHDCENQRILEQIQLTIKPHAEEFAKNFYREMLSDSHAVNFLNHDIVKNRLRDSMTHWICEAFVYLDSESAIENHIEKQIQVGLVHSRIGLPIHLVNYGMFFLKKDILNLLINTFANDKSLGLIMIVTNQILDCALALINESFERSLIVNEKNSQAFKMQFSAHNLAFDCERLRTSLSDWMRQLLLDVQQQRFDSKSFATIRHSNFGLWITHKAKLFLSNRAEFVTLVKLLDDIDEVMHKLVKNFKEDSVKNQALSELDTFVSQAIWVLGEISKEIIDQNNGRDTLTRLFNRRYLETVLRHETECSLSNGLRFGVLYVDIDFFKKINDEYGHDNGDKILVQFAEILTHEIRAGDFVFRLGGEEFLIVLGDVTIEILEKVAEKIRFHIERYHFKITGGRILNLTASLGIALHDGHPDFNRTIKMADEALYQSKNNGRNCVTVAPQLKQTY